MRPALIAALVALCACTQATQVDLPPLESFYYPTSIAHAPPVAPATRGTLYVATSNFDKRYDFGAVTAVNLDALGWGEGNAFKDPWYLSGAAPGALPSSTAVITDLKIAEEQRVLISSFAGTMGVYVTEEGARRLFVPTRSEGDYVFALEARAEKIGCLGSDARDCTKPEAASSAMSLTIPGEKAGEEASAEGYRLGKPRAPSPFAAAVRQSDGTVFVTHLDQADSPLDSRKALESFLVTIDAKEPKVTPESFIPLGVATSNGIAVGNRYAYVTGQTNRVVSAPALRLVERQPARDAQVITRSVENDFRLLFTRGVALSADEQRLFLLTRSPDALVVLSVTGAQTDSPSLALVSEVPLPAGGNDVKLIPRGPGRGALLAITCTNADAVAIYDDEIGLITSVVHGVGKQPFNIAVDTSTGTMAPGSRLYVTNFADGRVAVIDIPDLNRPYDAFVVAMLGGSQVCVTEGQDATGCAGVAE